MREPPRFVGINVMPEYFQVEGVSAVLDRVQRLAGATAITTCPYVMRPADAATGAREPPIDGGAGSVRRLDRPLWDGKRELFVATAPAFVPDRNLYTGLRYQPPEPDALTASDREIVVRAIRDAKNRGLEVHLQLQAASPPGYRVSFGGPEKDDLPRMPDGALPEGRVDNNASLASPHVRRYLRAAIADLCRAFPEIDGIRLDWPEYPPYRLDDLFFDFSSPARDAARRLGFDFEEMRRDVFAAWQALRGGAFGGAILDELHQAPTAGLTMIMRLLLAAPGLLQMLRFRAALSAELLEEAKSALAACGPHRRLAPNAFPPPWSFLSGFDFCAAASCCDAISVKLYTMHWPMILRFYADRLLEWHPSLDRDRLAQLLVQLADIGAGEVSRLDDLRYPSDDEPHPASSEAQQRKIRFAKREAKAGGSAAIRALVHGYGPAHDFRSRLEAVFETSDRQVWINRYGYLSDAKLAAIGQVTAA